MRPTPTTCLDIPSLNDNTRKAPTRKHVHCLHFAHALLQSVFPQADVETKVNNSAQVTISSGATKIVTVAQRDLYRKYRWPAEPTLKQHLELVKEEMEG